MIWYRRDQRPKGFTTPKTGSECLLILEGEATVYFGRVYHVNESDLDDLLFSVEGFGWVTTDVEKWHPVEEFNSSGD